MSNVDIPLFAAIPFFTLLAVIALLPLIGEHLWTKLYPYISFSLATITFSYYQFFLHDVGPVTYALYDYLNFITLIGALYIVAGGIHVNIQTKSTPLLNVSFLAAGALAANLVGTTGASMIFIRPYLQINRHRIKAYHIVFFIFIISNMAGILSPVGDPPLFIGYLKGIPFFWPMANLWHIWLLALSVPIIIFYLLDLKTVRTMRANHFETEPDLQKRVEVSGLHNLIFLLIVLAAVFISQPPFLREFVMTIAAMGSYFTTKKEIHKKNDFSFVPIKEVSVLFLGIFVTMVPALEWINHNAMNFGLQTAGQFYWYTGALSSILDNTPTYLNFLSAASGAFVSSESARIMFPFIQCHGVAIHHSGTYLLSASYLTPEAYRIHDAIINPHSVVHSTIKLSDASITYLLHTKNSVIQAISAGAVFFGAMTYIGNGPNFMVKKIAEESGVECPSFIRYILQYSVPVLLPVFLLVWVIFFK